MKMMSSTSSTSNERSDVNVCALGLRPGQLPYSWSIPSIVRLPDRQESVWSIFALFSKQAQVIHTGGPHAVHYLDHIAEVSAGIRLDVDDLFRPIRQSIFTLPVKLSGVILSAPK